MSDDALNTDQDWLMEESTCNPLKMAQWETLFTLANGYCGLRGSLETSPLLGDPGFFVAGVFDTVEGGKDELVNLPAWVGLELNMGGFDLDITEGEVLNYRRRLNMRSGTLECKIDYRDPAGRTTRWESKRLVGINKPHLGMIWGTITPLDYSDKATLTGSIDAWSTKYGSDSGQNHYEDLEAGDLGEGEGIELGLKTSGTGILVAEAARIEIEEESSRSVRVEDDLVAESLSFQMKEGIPVSFSKKVSFFTSRDVADPAEKARKKLKAFAKLPAEKLAEEHRREWAKIWADSDVVIEGDPRAQKAARFNIFHLASLGNSRDDRVSLGAKGLHGNGYKGQVFWDTEQYMVPFFTYTCPEAAKALLKYRYNLLEDARSNAARVDCPGARFPWNSSFHGREEQFKAFGWQDHQTADVAYAVDSYVRATGDREFYLDSGAEMIIETGRFWTGRVEWDADKRAYVITHITGSDEIHTSIENNALTNYLARFNLLRAARAVQDLREAGRWDKLRQRLGLEDDEDENWRAIAKDIYMTSTEPQGFHEQFDSFFELEDRMADRSMKPVEYTGKVLGGLEETQVNKQADTALLYYLFPDDFPDEMRRKGFDYYEPRTAHCSSLSRSIYAALGAQVGRTEEAYRLWLKGAEVDYDEEASCDGGIHAASLGGAWQALVFGFAGMQINNDGSPVFEPNLPSHWKRLCFRIQWRGERMKVDLRPGTGDVSSQ